MISAVYVLNVDSLTYQFQVFDEFEPKFDEALIKKNVRAGKYAPAPILNWITNSGEWFQEKALADSIPFLTPF